MTIKLKQILLTFLLLTGFAMSKAQSNSNSIIGVWYLEEYKSKIEVYRCGDQFCGKILESPSVYEEDGKTIKKDVKNPNKTLRDRSVVGIEHLTNLTFKKGEYIDGKIYDTSRGKVWDCYVEIKKDEMHFTGYVGVKWLGKTVVWKRVTTK